MFFSLIYKEYMLVLHESGLKTQWQLSNLFVLSESKMLWEVLKSANQNIFDV